MPTTHEFLDYIRLEGPITRRDLENFFAIDDKRSSYEIKRLTLFGCVRYSGMQPREDEFTRAKKAFEITQRGVEKLEYFNDGHCKSEICSCKE